ncbi:hypothetical protein HD806DRAFT_480792 [Xylariaceae sp. AK1471]|nr:hypothetical protein HD806DRAFT_480792 [Xylariaceae sp. AK1471]
MVSSKRPIEADDASGPAVKKHRKGFRVGPDNLPDGPWRRRVDKIKKDLIHKAKVKKAYKKIKVATTSSSKPTLTDTGAGSVTIVTTTDSNDDGTNHGNDERKGEPEPPSPQLHPERQAMLDGDDIEVAPLSTNEDHQIPGAQRQRQRPSRQNRKPGYFDKAMTIAERKKAEAAERAAEQERREAEWRRKTDEREHYQRAMAKARKPGRDGQRRLGRESGLLLEKVKKMVG